MTEPILLSLTAKAPQESGVYTWTFPGAPIRINIRLDVVLRLQAAANRTSPGGRLLEIGGVLLGHSRSATVEISDYLLIPSEKGSRGYTLNEFEFKRSLSKPGPSRDSERGLSVVGYFRTQQESSLMLRDDEIELVHRHFNDPTQVILLIRALPEQTSAGFLFWEGGVLTPFSFLEFPLDAELLRFEATPPSKQASLAGPAKQVEATGKDQKRRRRLRGTLLAVFATVLALAGLSAFLMRERWMPAPKQATPAAIQQAPAPTPARFPLQLDVEAQGKGLNIRWNPQSVPVTQAREGHLVITEPGQQPQIITLDPAQLASGHVYYQSPAVRLEFRLEVLDSSGTTSRESVLALSSKPAAPLSPQSAGREPSAIRQVQTIPIPDPATELTGTEKIVQAPRQFTAPPSQTRAEPARAVVLEPAPPETGESALARSIRPPGTVNALPALTVPPPPSATERAGNQPPAERATNPPAPSPTNAVSSPSVQTVRPEPLPPSVTQIPPVAKWKVSPAVDPTIRAQIRKDVEIAIRARIDEKGQVTRAEAVSHDGTAGGYLEAAAINAMLKWRFAPARLGDKAVPSEQTVTFVFRKE